MEEKQNFIRNPYPAINPGRRPPVCHDKRWWAVLQVEDDNLPTSFRITLARKQVLRGCHIAPALGPDVMLRLVYSGNLEVLALKNCGSFTWQADQDGVSTLITPDMALIPPMEGGLVLTFPEAPGVRVRFLGFIEPQS